MRFHHQKWGRTSLNAERAAIFDEIPKQNNRITKSRELLLADAITPNDYKQIKAEGEKSIIRLEAKINDLSQKIAFDYDIFSIVDESLETLKNIVKLHENADMERKQYIVGSIFPEKFVFDGEIDRTARMNLVFQLIYHINNKLEDKKKGVSPKFKTNSLEVLLGTHLTNSFINDMKKIADIHEFQTAIQWGENSK